MNLVRRGRTKPLLLSQTMMRWNGMDGVVPLSAAIVTGVAVTAAIVVCVAGLARCRCQSAAATAMIAVRIVMVVATIAGTVAIGMVGIVEIAYALAAVDIGDMAADGIVATSIRVDVRAVRHGFAGFPARAFLSALVPSDCGDVGGHILVIRAQTTPYLNM